MNAHHQLGRRGEQMALRYLRRKDYRILERNYHTRWGEIDIIAWQKDTLVFIEVKTAGGRSFGPPRSWVGWRKRSHLVRAANTYLLQHRMEETDCRFDVIAIELTPGRSRLTHIINAFSA